MGKKGDVKAFIGEFGLTNLALKLSEETGCEFSAQQLNHWKTRGVPYKWQDVFSAISGLSKDKLRAADINPSYAGLN